MVDTLYTTETPASSDTDDGVSRQLGLRYEAQVDGQVTGGRYWVPSAGLPPTALWQLWEVTGASSGTLLAEVDLTALPSPTPGGWMAVPLGTPVAQSGSTEYIVCSYTSGGSFVFTFPSGGVLPLTSTPDGHAVADAAVFRNGSPASTYPLAAGGDAGAEDGLFFADVDFETSTGRTGEVASTAPAGQAAAAGATVITGSVASTAPAAQAAGAAAVVAAGVAASAAPAGVAALSGVALVAGSASTSAPAGRASAAGAVRVSGSAASTAPAGVAAASAGEEATPGQLSAGSVASQLGASSAGSGLSVASVGSRLVATTGGGDA